MTSAERTLVDTCSLVPAPVLETAVDHALRVGDAHLPRLVRVVAEAPATGPGSLQPIRAVLADRVAGYDPGDSRRELDLVKLLAGAGFEPPTQQVRVRVEGRTYFVDAAWPALKVGFEYDSVRFHHSVSAFHRDRERLRRL
ncbi:MAG TPA: hypothetical protein VFO65_04005, partial [Acidimicrobiales bacterium]|nr:hypothetical protein [Acidimicrobiales bacterium]